MFVPRLMKRFAFPVLFLLSLTVVPVQSAEPSDPFRPPNFPLPEFPDRQFNVKDFGASGGGKKNDTAAINKAIEACNKAGGGDVVFPAGTYAAASICLKSNVRFMLDKDAVITGAESGYDPPEPNPKFDKYQDFGHSHFHNALMWGENIENIAIIGGKVNGGHIIHGDPKEGQDIGDKLISIRVGKNLLFKDVTHETGGHFVYLLNDCENVTIENIVVKKSRDAVDLMGCRNVQISGCNFTGCGDDTIGIKSDYALGRKIKSENIYVWDCYFETGCNGVQFGSETAGDFSNINIWNVTVGKANKAAIGITCNDGAVIDGVNYKDITIKGATTPIFMLITERLRTGEPNAKVGTIKNVTMSNVTITDCRRSGQGQVNPITISGVPKSHLENIVLENIKVTYDGGGTKDQANEVPRYPQKPGEYSPRHLGVRPASGLYARHVKGLTLRNVEIDFEKEDQRPPLVAFDVDGLELENFKTEKAQGVETLRLEKVNNLSIRNSPGLPDATGENIAKGKK
jgi:polygalacturonase